MDTDLSELHPVKASSSMDSTLSGISIEVISLQSLNA